MGEQFGRGPERIRLLGEALLEPVQDRLLGALAHDEAAAHREVGLLVERRTRVVQHRETHAVGVPGQHRQRVQRDIGHAETDRGNRCRRVVERRRS